MSKRYEQEQSQRKHRYEGSNREKNHDRSCPQRKVNYSSYKVALQKIAEAYNVTGVLLRCYKCPHCGQWHLTSMLKTAV
jgi:hypothetical protein